MLFAFQLSLVPEIQTVNQRDLNGLKCPFVFEGQSKGPWAVVGWQGIASIREWGEKSTPGKNALQHLGRR